MLTVMLLQWGSHFNCDVAGLSDTIRQQCDCKWDNNKAMMLSIMGNDVAVLLAMTRLLCCCDVAYFMICYK
jgi:hypothetical protein